MKTGDKVAPTDAGLDNGGFLLKGKEYTITNAGNHLFIVSDGVDEYLVEDEDIQLIAPIKHDTMIQYKCTEKEKELLVKVRQRAKIKAHINDLEEQLESLNIDINDLMDNIN